MVAMIVILFHFSRAFRGLDGGRSTKDDRTAPAGLKRSGRRPATAFLSGDAKPKAAEKS
jgi:hypothetical protein